MTVQLLSLKEAAGVLSVSTESVRRLFATGALRSVHPTPGTTKVRSDDLDAYIESMTAPRPRRVTPVRSAS